MARAGMTPPFRSAHFDQRQVDLLEGIVRSLGLFRSPKDSPEPEHAPHQHGDHDQTKAQPQGKMRPLLDPWRGILVVAFLGLLLHRKRR